MLSGRWIDQLTSLHENPPWRSTFEPRPHANSYIATECGQNDYQAPEREPPELVPSQRRRLVRANSENPAHGYSRDFLVVECAHDLYRES